MFSPSGRRAYWTSGGCTRDQGLVVLLAARPLLEFLLEIARLVRPSQVLSLLGRLVCLLSQLLLGVGSPLLLRT